MIKLQPEERQFILNLESSQMSRTLVNDLAIAMAVVYKYRKNVVNVDDDMPRSDIELTLHDINSLIPINYERTKTLVTSYWKYTKSVYTGETHAVTINEEMPLAGATGLRHYFSVEEIEAMCRPTMGKLRNSWNRVIMNYTR